MSIRGFFLMYPFPKVTPLSSFSEPRGQSLAPENSGTFLGTPAPAGCPIPGAGIYLAAQPQSLTDFLVLCPSVGLVAPALYHTQWYQPPSL